MTKKRVFKQNKDYNNVIATYLVKTKIPIKDFCEKMIYEQTVGISNYTEIKRNIPYNKAERIESCIGSGSYHSIEVGHETDKEQGNTYIVDIEYPLIDFDPTGDLPQLLSIVAGQIFANVDAKRFRIIDLHIPPKIMGRFKGPKFGRTGIRKLLNRKDRLPLIGVIIRPNLGLNCDDYLEICREAAQNKVDFIKDDEKFVNPSYCPYEDRIPKIINELDSIYQKTGHKTIYVVNGTTKVNNLKRNIKRIKKLGAEMVLLDAFYVGLSSVQSLSEERDISIPIYGHRAGYATFSRSRDYGIDTLVLSKLLRISGVDMFSVGMIGGVNETFESEIQKHLSAALDRDGWYEIKPSLPIVTAGMHPGMVLKNIEVYGTDIAIFSGKGVHGHPDGLGAGIRAMQQAIEVTIKKIPLGQVFGNKKFNEFEKALSKFGLYEEDTDIIKSRIEP